MDLYVLDVELKRYRFVYEYETLIWTERRRRYGDFVLIMNADLAYQDVLTRDSHLVIGNSNRIMSIKKIELFMDEEDDVEKLKITGRTLEALLQNRPNQVTSISSGSSADPRVLTGLPAAIARGMFSEICRTNADIPDDNIPFIQSGAITPAGSIAEPASSVEIRFGLETLYDSQCRIADTYNLGFRLIRDGENSRLYFEVYTGSDRSINQSARAAVVFNSELDAMTNRRHLLSANNSKNVAYVFAPNGSRIVIADGTDPGIEGFDRRVLIVKADDITLSTGPSLDAALTQRGKEALAKTRIVDLFDCENVKYVYGEDYNLGDMVTQVDDQGIATTMRVEEQTFISDIEGVRDYPTLTG